MPTVLVTKINSNSQEESFNLNQDDIIYEGFEKLGIELPHGCLAGSCGACKIEIIEGYDNLSLMSHVEKDTVDFIKLNIATKASNPNLLNTNIRLSCRAKVHGPIKFKNI